MTIQGDSELNSVCINAMMAELGKCSISMRRIIRLRKYGKWLYLPRIYLPLPRRIMRVRRIMIILGIAGKFGQYHV